ncbi:DinB family protein [Pigmentiphaga soli]|uniref:DinB family protein n=1 Tax=Pigmentiphaga soli TaxID=1007095 RepID=A0ABP8GKE2_9BURK
MIDHFLMFAHYNAWANGRLYDAVAALDDAAYRADRGAFFKSVHGTLNHLLVTDCIWLGRFTGEGGPGYRLDAILFQDFDALRRARVAQDQAILDYVAGLDAAALEADIRYRRVVDNDDVRQPLAQALAHLFNHQTHHRAQVHTILTGLGAEGPELDLLAYQRLRAAGRA